MEQPPTTWPIRTFSQPHPLLWTELQQRFYKDFWGGLFNPIPLDPLHWYTALRCIYVHGQVLRVKESIIIGQEPTSIVYYIWPGSSFKQPTLNYMATQHHVNWGVVYTESNCKIMDPVSSDPPLYNIQGNRVRRRRKWKWSIGLLRTTLMASNM